MEYPELKHAVCEQCAPFAASVVLIEDKASGTQLIQELVAEGLHAVTRYQPQSDKIMRMHAQTAMIENGFVHLPKEAAWLAEYPHELTVFPKGKHDDQVDSTSQMLDWYKRAGGDGAGIWYYYKGLCPPGGTSDRSARTVIGDGQTARHPPALVRSARAVRSSMVYAAGPRPLCQSIQHPEESCAMTAFWSLAEKWKHQVSLSSFAGNGTSLCVLGSQPKYTKTRVLCGEGIGFLSRDLTKFRGGVAGRLAVIELSVAHEEGGRRAVAIELYFLESIAKLKSQTTLSVSILSLSNCKVSGSNHATGGNAGVRIRADRAMIIRGWCEIASSSAWRSVGEPRQSCFI
jgi:predicted phage terminase large subunit-like protein